MDGSPHLGLAGARTKKRRCRSTAEFREETSKKDNNAVRCCETEFTQTVVRAQVVFRGAAQKLNAQGAGLGPGSAYLGPLMGL
jgi:hypothetical protein